MDKGTKLIRDLASARARVNRLDNTRQELMTKQHDNSKMLEEATETYRRAQVALLKWAETQTEE